MSYIGAFWRNIQPKPKRVFSVLIFLVVAILVLVVGSYSTPSYNAALAEVNHLNHTFNQVSATGTGAVFEMIYLNNLILCLLMFIPLIGAGIGLFLIYETGVGLGEISMVQGTPIALDTFNMLMEPIFWLEFAAYAIAMSASIWLFYRLIQRRWREIEYTCKAIAASGLLLLTGAVIEALQVTGYL